MKSIIIALVLVGSIAGAFVLYNNLSDKADTGNGGLIIVETDSQNDHENETESSLESEPEINSEAQTEFDSEAQTEFDSEAQIESDTEKTEEIINNMLAEHDFSMTDLNGNSVKLSDLVGKPIVLNFWATWCGYCKMEMPDFEQIYKKYGNEITFVMVNVTETAYTAKKFIESEGYTFPVYVDANNEGAQKYGTDYGIPMSFFFNKYGEAVAYVTGAIDTEILEKAIEMIK